MALFSLYLYLFLLILIFFSELTNHSRESMQRSRHFSCLFSTLFSKCCHDFKQRWRHFSKFFPIFYQSRLLRFFTIVGYFTSETIMALSNGNISTFFIQKQGKNETQHIYFGGRRKTTLGTQHNITLQCNNTGMDLKATSDVFSIITCGAKLQNADWLRQRQCSTLAVVH